MKYVFLDIDGVLNSEQYFYANEDNILDRPLDEACVKRLADAAVPCGARIILSSSWRSGWDKDPDKTHSSCRVIDDLMGRYGMRVYDKTKELRNGKREDEILLYLGSCPDRPDGYVIIDDNDYHWERYGMQTHWVRPDFRDGGLKDDDAEEAGRILGMGLTIGERLRLRLSYVRLLAGRWFANEKTYGD